MKGILLRVIVVAAIAGGQQRGAPVFRSGVQEVFVDVSVLSERSPLTTLDQADFVVTDNGKRQRVESVDAASLRLDVSLVLDATWFTQGLAPGTGPSGSDELHRNARQIVALLRPEDRLGVITFADDVVETRPMSVVSSSPQEISFANPTTYAVTQRFRAAEAVLTALTAPVSADRRHLIVLGSAARLKSSVPLEEHLLPAARRADALLYTVLSPPTRTAITNRQLPLLPSEVVTRQAMTAAAEATGGKAYLTGDIVGAFRDVLNELRTSYVLRYTLEGLPSAGWHNIVVKVPSCPTCTIRARRGYMGR